MGWMKKGLLIGGMAAALMTGCGNSAQQRNSSSSGSLALSTDDSRLFAADTDNGVVSVIDTQTDTKLYDVKVGVRPMRVAVGGDNTLFVANRGSRSVSVIRSGERTVSAEIATGVDPTGMAVSFDGKTLYIVSATAKDNTDYGILQAVDTTTLEVKYEKAIGYEPRSIALISNEKALVTQYRGLDHGADVVEVNLNTGEVTNGGKTGLYDQVNFSRKNDSTNLTASTFSARGMTDVVVTPDGRRAFVPTVWAREDAIGRRPSSAGGYYSAGGPCSVGAVATAGIVTLETGSNTATPSVDDLTDCVSRGTVNTESNFPPTAMGTGGFGFGGGTTASTEAVQGPSAAVVDPTGEWLFVVNKETSNVAIMPAWRRQGRDGENIDINSTGNSFRSVVGVGSNPAFNSGSDGIALTRDGRRAYVYNQFQHEVVRLGNEQGGPTSEVTRIKTIGLALTDTLDSESVKGRRDFFDAQSTRISSAQTHVACSTCHLEGRDDGHVWSFPDGLRQTPTLVGRGLTKTEPLHWTGEFADFNAFMSHTVISRMGGSGTDATTNANMVKWLESEPLVENANLRAGGLTDAQLRGQAVYAQAQCNTCHVGEFLTNGTLQDVGTTEMGVAKFDTPSLKGIARSAPYLHDGRFTSLRDRLDGQGDKHGTVVNLTSDQKNDLVEYLKTL